MNTNKRYECHGHMMMDGADFSSAKKRHSESVDIDVVREELLNLKQSGVVYFRDGGDNLGVSIAARSLAPEYGIQFVTPAFAIHKKRHYGSIVGKTFSDILEYRGLLEEAKSAGCDFIKLMFSGIITFQNYGELSCPGLLEEEICELVAIAHGEGFAVMAHVNGSDTVRSAIKAGTDSIEHGYFMDDNCLQQLAESQSIWVPTIAATNAFIGRPGFDSTVAEETVRVQKENVRRALALGAIVAAGSDSGAVGVPHGEGTATEYRLLIEAGADPEQLEFSNRQLQSRFQYGR